MKLNLGSGYTYFAGFKNLDADKKCDPDFLLDIRDLSSIESNSVDEIYTAHTLEHILLTHLFKTVRGFCRILKPGGKITIIVPDTETVSGDWSKNKIPGFYFEKIVLGATPGATEYMFHQQLFWKKKMIRYLTIAGFYKIESKSLRPSYELRTTASKPIRSSNAKTKSTSRNR